MLVWTEQFKFYYHGYYTNMIILHQGLSSYCVMRLVGFIMFLCLTSIHIMLYKHEGTMLQAMHCLPSKNNCTVSSILNILSFSTSHRHDALVSTKTNEWLHCPFFYILNWVYYVLYVGELMTFVRTLKKCYCCTN